MAVADLRIAHLVVRSRDPAALAAFHRDAFGFVDASTSDDAIVLDLGGTRLRIEGTRGRAYPADVPGWSPLFQHFAIRVADMPSAYARLRRTTGWRPISRDGPQRLPATTGGVTAFKFRDPDGHPLELLAFPEARTPASAIDHTAISVTDVERSIAFYERLGFTVAGRTTNRGVEQERLDAIDGVDVDVVAMAPSLPSAIRLELLGYRGAYDRAGRANDDDVAATRIVLAGRDGRTAESIVDPDGHRLEIAG